MDDALLAFWLPFATFTVVMSITPGPNNLMLLASGALYGFRRTVPHLLGVAGGFGIMLALFCLGLAQAFEQVPGLRELLRWVGIAYLGWLAWKLLGAGAPGAAGASRPLGWLDAAVFQWVNPKAWMMALTAVSTFIAPHARDWLGDAAAAVLVSALINLACVSLWAGCGAALRRLLGDARRRLAFNGVMAVLTALTAIGMAR